MNIVHTDDVNSVGADDGCSVRTDDAIVVWSYGITTFHRKARR